MGMTIWETETLFNMGMLHEFGKMKAERRCLSCKGTWRQVKITEIEGLFKLKVNVSAMLVFDKYVV